MNMEVDDSIDVLLQKKAEIQASLIILQEQYQTLCKEIEKRRCINDEKWSKIDIVEANNGL